ncbi:beta-galactosidase [Labilibaculum filiforme]|uniref:Beta-galactosidase n=1 Tax=Labilibaculum filiforme TaxID=1940526 RepID=A0A2N3HTM9_9BACT|nr:glycoside hydrolase family 2 TIM barrel-domain containing protein [Labilibaculum filiforme]PKQ61397.1 beta-galactosidase [Labilibaculum filiforme]
MKIKFTFTVLLFIVGLTVYAQERSIITLSENWKFTKGEVIGAENTDFNANDWETVAIPHDWAIYGPFDKEIDKQTVQIFQNNEKKASEKYGRTGALPHIGIGWYRTTFKVPEYKKGKQALLIFDGAMSNALVYVNGQKVGSRPYGYSYFYFDISNLIEEGKENFLAVRLENPAKASRWYPGAGIYRKVQVIVKEDVNFKQWGTFITTPFVSEKRAKVQIKTTVQGEDIHLETIIKDANGEVVGAQSSNERYNDELDVQIPVENPQLWSTENPYLYTAELKLYQNQQLKDVQEIRFGIRSIKYSAEKGFELNGKVTKFKGVCLHHDLGPLGAAVNKSALKRQLRILKDMGCNAIRSAHNMPSHEQLDLCDEMGFLFLAESFDEWAKPKVENGYNLHFKKWAEKDVVNLVRATRNHPCIVMWSSGNEVPDQHGSLGVKRAKYLQDIFHREDPTRPVTVGMDQVKAVMESGFGSIMDVPGLNYRVHLYEEAYEKFPQGFLLGSETASTVSSRGIYKFPVVMDKGVIYPDGQCSSYDLEYCNWSNVPDDDFVLQDDKDWVIGEFVWTGFDYLGEPTPYDKVWPSRSSYFGICDLAGLPKDRYYLYRSRWNTEDETLHILPHWNWEGREGETTPVFVYTNYKSAELFVNGISKGIKRKSKENNQTRYRLMWNEVKYEPGTLKVIAFDDNGNAVAEKEIKTAGAVHHLELSADRKIIKANGKDLCFVTVSIVDKEGNFCPTAINDLQIKVSGAGKFRAVCNGDASSLELFHMPKMKAFSGKLVVLVQSDTKAGEIKLQVNGKGLKTGRILIKSVL